MSTVKVAAIQHPSAATAAITLDAAGGALIGGQAAYARNLVYNGAMQVAQRGTSVTGITSGGYYTADRYASTITSIGTWTQSIESDAPTGSGFRKSLKMLCTTADAAPAASDIAIIYQNLEGQDLQRIAKGTSSAQQLTLSLWVKSNVTGTYTVCLIDIDNNRVVAAAYSVSASATWEKKTITFPADTTGAFDNDNAASFQVRFFLGAGSDYTTGALSTTWTAGGSAVQAAGQTNLAAATNNYWQVTGVQLEVGPAATPFEFKSFGEELAKCQRYYWRVATGDFKPICNAFYYNATAVYGVIQYPVSMRANPVFDIPNATAYFSFDANGVADTFATFNTISPITDTQSLIGTDAGVSGTGGMAGYIRTANAASYFALSAEL